MIEEKRIDELALTLARLERKVDFLLQTLNLQYQETNLPHQTQLESLLRRGRHAEALKLLRQHLDLTLPQAQAILEQIEKQQTNPSSPSLTIDN
jgi:hypothetical protein